MREREKAAREREARYSNGHLFTSLTVSGTTLCSACNKSITAKEALSCPSKYTSIQHTDTAPLHLRGKNQNTSSYFSRSMEVSTDQKQLTTRVYTHAI